MQKDCSTPQFANDTSVLLLKQDLMVIKYFYIVLVLLLPPDPVVYYSACQCLSLHILAPTSKHHAVLLKGMKGQCYVIICYPL